MSVEINATNFPDAAWRQFVSDNYDTNNDGILSDEEIASIIRIDLRNNTEVISIDFSIFSAISKLNIVNCPNLSTISISQNESIQELVIMLTAIESLNITNLSNLTYLVLNGTNEHQISSISFGTHTRLTDLYLTFATISMLNGSNFINLRHLELGNCTVATANLSLCSDLRYLVIVRTNSLSQILCNDLALLQFVQIEYNASLTRLDFSGCSSLKSLFIYSNPNLSSLDITDCESLQCINAKDTSVLSYDISASQELIRIYRLNNTVVDNNYITYIDPNDPPSAEETIYQKYLRVPVGSTIQDTAAQLPVIIVQPQSITVVNNKVATFSVSAEGEELYYQWQQYDKTNSSWVNVVDETANTLSVTNHATANETIRFRCKVSNTVGTVYSEETLLTIIITALPIITTHPKSVSVIENETAIFNVEASGDDLKYQWQLSTDEENWADIGNATSDSYAIHPTINENGIHFRCVVSNVGGSITSNSATLTVTEDTRLTPPIITSHPSSVWGEDGQLAVFSVTAEGEDLHYQWQSNQNGTWYNISGATESILSLVASSGQNGKQYRCQISNSAGAIYSNAASLYVSAPPTVITTPVITNQPLSISKLEAQTAVFRIVAKGGSLSYQWQIKRGSSWYDITGATNAIYSTRASTDLNGTQYRCRVSNSAGTVYSSSATLTVRDLGPVPIYGYHSIIISGKNTYGEWDMYPTSRPHVAPPEVKTSYVDVPGADGGLDYTELLNEKPNYGYRKGSWEFLLIPQEKWPDVYRSLCNYLHGREHTIILEDDPNVVYTGRLSVNQWQSAAHNSLITIDYILDPVAVNTQDESYNPDEEYLEGAEKILRRPENADCVLMLWNDQITIVPLDSIYEDGDNITY